MDDSENHFIPTLRCATLTSRRTGGVGTDICRVRATLLVVINYQESEEDKLPTFIKNQSMTKGQSISLVTIYLLILLGVNLFCFVSILLSKNEFIVKYELCLMCILTAGIGGILYLLRAVYVNASAKKQWSNEWLPWYFIRPFTSLISGGVAFVFLQAGLLILEAKTETQSSNLGFYALSLIAGLNVDGFIRKIEELASSTWGITRTNYSSTGTSDAPINSNQDQSSTGIHSS